MRWTPRRRIAEETGFGYTRILGKLRKLGIRRIYRQTVKNILKEQGTDPRPKRGKGTWDEFPKNPREDSAAPATPLRENRD